MELVLGLATLATAISGATGAGHYSDAPEIKEAEPETAHTLSGKPYMLENPKGIDLPDSHVGEIGGKLKPWLDNLIGEKASIRREQEGNNTLETANDLDGYNGKYDNYMTTGQAITRAPFMAKSALKAMLTGINSLSMAERKSNLLSTALRTMIFA